MSTGFMLAALLLPVTLLLGVALVRQRRRLGMLQRQLLGTTTELQRLQESCARLGPAAAVDRLIADGGASAAERKEVTVLFADLVGYTALSARLEPALLARIMNGYFQRMSDAITAHRGHISTFIGDGIVAYFGALEPNPWQCDDAARAALAMREALAAYNAELRGQDLPGLALGIGLHRGTGITGWVGSRERLEYAFVGGTVSLAARVQAATRGLDGDILVTDSVREQLAPEFVLDAMPAIELKGIPGPVATHALRELR